jgi:glucosamine--fructose-6-phosphate aminotransferase (isomerizing)
MCGIVGYLGIDSEAIDAVLKGLILLQNRGYDSVGISTIYNNTIQTTKYASTTISNAIQLLQTSSEIINTKNSIAIGHTRWATHGSKTDINAHPHHDVDNRISLVHNGIIENFKVLKNQLLNDGYTFRSSTDTEVISVLIGSFLDKGESINMAIQKAVGLLKGTWALVILHKDYPNCMWAVRNGSPLLLGTNTQCIMVASEALAFHQYINQYIILKDHDVIEIKMENNEFIFNKNLHQYTTQIPYIEETNILPDPWPHWMLKEIMEQPESVLRSINNGGRILSEVMVKLGGLELFSNELKEVDHLILLGCGTSYNAGLWSLNVFKSLDIFDTISIYDGADFDFKDIPKKGLSAAVLLSQSGETKDLQRCIHILQEKSIVTIGIVNVIDSYIARETNCGIYLNAGREVAVASTKSFTNQCVVLTLLAVWFSQNKGTCLEKRRKIISDIHQLPIQLNSVLQESNLENIKNISSKMTLSSAFLLGKGKEEAIAKEGSLKIKEIARIHAEGYSTSALKHGPFGLLEDNLPVIFFDIGEEYREKTQNAIQEVKARDAKVFILSDNSKESFCLIEKNGTFGGLLANVCIQLLAYYCAVEKNISPDYPRNLAKVVTVE